MCLKKKKKYEANVVQVSCQQNVRFRKLFPLKICSSFWGVRGETVTSLSLWPAFHHFISALKTLPLHCVSPIKTGPTLLHNIHSKNRLPCGQERKRAQGKILELPSASSAAFASRAWHPLPHSSCTVHHVLVPSIRLFLLDSHYFLNYKTN